MGSGLAATYRHWHRMLYAAAGAGETLGATSEPRGEPLSGAAARPDRSRGLVTSPPAPSVHLTRLRLEPARAGSSPE